MCSIKYCDVSGVCNVNSSKQRKVISSIVSNVINSIVNNVT